MLGNFKYSNPTKLYFGADSLNYLYDELKNYGDNVLLVYGGGSIKKIGLYDEVVKILKECGKTIVEDSGVMPNPTVEKLHEGVERGRRGNVDFILAVGGGSVVDYAKAVSVSIHCDEEPWEKYYIKFEEPTCNIVPVGAILTMVGTGSEANGGSVITNHTQKLKIGHVFGEEVFPKFSILNPTYTFSVSKYQMISGIYDIMSHIMEQYFSGDDDNTSDYLMEGLMLNLVKAAKDAYDNPLNYEARSNIMWIATWALNTLVAKGKTTDWEVHMIGQAIAAHTDATHGMTLSAVTKAYYNYIMPYGLAKFKRFAINVWHVSSKGKTDEEVAKEGLEKLYAWMESIGLSMNSKEVGVTLDLIDGIVDSTLIMTGGYKVLTKEEVKEILIASMN